MKSNTRLKPHTEAGPKIAENERVELFKKEIGNREREKHSPINSFRDFLSPHS